VLPLDPGSGRAVWEYSPGEEWRPMKQPPFLTDDAVLVISRDGVLARLTPDGGFRWELPLGPGVGDTSSVGTDGRRLFLLAVSAEGKDERLVAIGESP